MLNIRNFFLLITLIVLCSANAFGQKDGLEGDRIVPKFSFKDSQFSPSEPYSLDVYDIDETQSKVNQAIEEFNKKNPGNPYTEFNALAAKKLIYDAYKNAYPTAKEGEIEHILSAEHTNIIGQVDQCLRKIKSFAGLHI